MDPTETVEAYYRALRRGDPLAPFFAEREDVVKFGVSERLAGYETIADGLREQTRTTENWRVESEALQVVARDPERGGSVAWFTDDVALAWTDATGDRRSFDTRWSGVLERDEGIEGDESTDWRFVQMHVSAPHDV
jgi:hypothetical protein